jgi:hypothetical protein
MLDNVSVQSDDALDVSEARYDVFINNKPNICSPD